MNGILHPFLPCPFPQIMVWMPLGFALAHAVWTDLRTGIIHNGVPLWIMVWSITMHCMGQMTLFPLSPVIMVLFLWGVYSFFTYRHKKCMMGGGDLKMITACALVVPPERLGPWIFLMGMGSLLTGVFYPSPSVPMAPAIGGSVLFILFF